MVRPRLSFCNQRHINTLDITAITHLFMGMRIEDLDIPSNQQRAAVHYFYSLMTSLNLLRTELSKYRTRKPSTSTVTTMSGKIYKLQKSQEKTKRKSEKVVTPHVVETEEDELVLATTKSGNHSHENKTERNLTELHRVYSDLLLRNWSQLTDQLTMRPLITTLLPHQYLMSLASRFEEFIIHCQKMGIRCDMKGTGRGSEGWEQWLHSDFFRSVTAVTARQSYTT